MAGKKESGLLGTASTAVVRITTQVHLRGQQKYRPVLILIHTVGISVVAQFMGSVAGGTVCGAQQLTLADSLVGLDRRESSASPESASVSHQSGHPPVLGAVGDSTRFNHSSEKGSDPRLQNCSDCPPEHSSSPASET